MKTQIPMLAPETVESRIATAIRVRTVVVTPTEFAGPAHKTTFAAQGG